MYVQLTHLVIHRMYCLLMLYALWIHYKDERRILSSQARKPDIDGRLYKYPFRQKIQFRLPSKFHIFLVHEILNPTGIQVDEREGKNYLLPYYQLCPDNIMHKEIWEANASSKYAPNKLIFNLKRIPRSNPLILKYTPLQPSRSVIPNGPNTIKCDLIQQTYCSNLSTKFHQAHLFITHLFFSICFLYMFYYCPIC